MQEIDRTRRVAEVIKRDLATLILREISDPRLRGVSINSVTVSRDLANATIYVSSLENQESVEKLLNNAAGYLRRLLGKNADFRVTPSLRFRYDNSIQRGVEMSTLIDSLVRKPERSTDEPDTEDES